MQGNNRDKLADTRGGLRVNLDGLLDRFAFVNFLCPSLETEELIHFLNHVLAQIQDLNKTNHVKYRAICQSSEICAMCRVLRARM
jgi:hypothetical protein